jgi:hypothetical protein
VPWICFWVLERPETSCACGVVHPASRATFCNVTWTFNPSGVRPVADVPGGKVCPPLGVVGVGHPVKALADMRAAEARSRYIGAPEGVAESFQVRSYKIDPRTRCWSLLTKEAVSPALALLTCCSYDAMAFRPDMAGVFEASVFARSTKGLAGEGAGSNGAIVVPPGATEGVGPHSDAGAEVDLDVSAEVIGGNISN